jgi:prophage regulatory protein
MGTFSEDRYLRLPEVQKRIPLSKSGIYRLVTAGKLAPPHRLGARCSAWLASDIADFISQAPVATGQF